MDLGISGKRAAVAASSQGLGFATAAALAENGVTVAICSRDPCGSTPPLSRSVTTPSPSSPT